MVFGKHFTRGETGTALFASLLALNSVFTLTACSEGAKEKEGAIKPATEATPEQEAAKEDSVMPKATWSVQARAFCQKVDAKTLVQNLRDKGYEAYSVEAIVKGRLWHRVRLGNLATRDEAQDLRNILKSTEGFSDAFLVNNSLLDSHTENVAKPTMEVESLPTKPAPTDAKSPETATTVRQQFIQVPETGRVQPEKPKGEWSVQVKALPNLTEAVKVAAKLRDKGYNPYVSEAFVQRCIWYRLRVGDLVTREEAEALRKILKSREGFSDAFVVRR